MVSDPYDGLTCKYVRTYRKYIRNLQNYQNIPDIGDENYNNHSIAKLRKKIFNLEDQLSEKGYDWNRNIFNLQILDEELRVVD